MTADLAALSGSTAGVTTEEFINAVAMAAG
jgi:hypothetical protein